jgi:hypothetical protein
MNITLSQGKAFAKTDGLQFGRRSARSSAMSSYQAKLTQSYTSPRHDIHVWCHGTEQQPVIVIDDYLDDPQSLIDLAANGPAFAPLGPYYPGIRAPFPDSALPPLLAPLTDICTRHFGNEGPPELRECSFSLVTTPPTDLMPIQCLPHFDSLEYGRIAALLFLCDGTNNGGTAFYRQRSTGFETVDAGRYGQFADALNRDVSRFGLPAAGYIGDDNPMYETLALHDAKFNRMLIYASATLHSGAIPQDFSFSPDPRVGRLTVNAFLGPSS